MLAMQMALNMIGPYGMPARFAHNDLPLWDVVEILVGGRHTAGRYERKCGLTLQLRILTSQNGRDTTHLAYVLHPTIFATSPDRRLYCFRVDGAT